MAHTILQASTTVSALFLSLVAMFVVLKESGRLAGMGRRGLRSYSIGYWTGFLLLTVSVAASITAIWFLLGHAEYFAPMLILFLATLVGTVVVAVAAIVIIR